MTASFEEMLVADARLVMLKALVEQTDGRLNETLLTAALDSLGHRRSRDWVRTQLRVLADLGGVRISVAGTVMIAEITRLGTDHVERRQVIEGVKRPSPGA